MAQVVIVAAALKRGEPVDRLLPRVQKRRMLPTRVIQAGQKAVQDRVIGAVLSGQSIRVPLAIKLLDGCPVLQRIPGRIIGLGIRRERVRSPVAGRTGS